MMVTLNKFLKVFIFLSLGTLPFCKGGHQPYREKAIETLIKSLAEQLSKSGIKPQNVFSKNILK
jgi:hypothetical protein